MKKIVLNYLKPIQLPMLVCLFSAFFIGCSSEYSNEEEPIVQEITKPNKIMLYKFYKSKSAGLLQGQKMVEYINAFNKIYDENDVTVIGTWYLFSR